MAERPHIMGSPPEGGKFRLVAENGHMSFIGMMPVGLKDEGTEREEEVNLAPPNGTKVVFLHQPQFGLKDDSTLTYKISKEAVFCQVELAGHHRPYALMFPDRIVLLEWLVSNQEVKLFEGERDPRSHRNPYYHD